MAHHAGIGAHGLWSISRGLARGLASGVEGRSEYKRMTDHADMPRQGDLDGRGNLSQRALRVFVLWFLQVCLDQLKFVRVVWAGDVGQASRRLRPKTGIEAGSSQADGRSAHSRAVRARRDLTYHGFARPERAPRPQRCHHRRTPCVRNAERSRLTPVSRGCARNSFPASLSGSLRDNRSSNRSRTSAEMRDRFCGGIMDSSASSGSGRRQQPHVLACSPFSRATSSSRRVTSWNRRSVVSRRK
jgi:hypothetical protein